MICSWQVQAIVDHHHPGSDHPASKVRFKEEQDIAEDTKTNEEESKDKNVPEQEALEEVGCLMKNLPDINYILQENINLCVH